MIREILKEHNERRRKHSNVLKRCLELWLSIPFEKDKLFDNPQSIWLDECMQHFYSYTKTYEFVDADFHPLSITIGRLFSEYMEPYVRRQHEISIEIKQKLIEVVTNIIKGVNKAFTDSSVGERIFDSEHSHQRIDPTTLNQAQSSFTCFEDTSRQIWIVITRRSRGLVL
jgi:tyrosyl-tRNA synthetase